MTSYACPHCHRLDTQLLEVRYSIGLEDRAPELMCGTCVGELRAQEDAYSRGDGSARAVWAIEILRAVGTAAAARPIRAPAEPDRPLRAPRPRPKRATRGAVEV